MDFFEAQDTARSRSHWLVLLFGLSVVTIIVTVYGVVHFTVGPGPGHGLDFGLLLLVAAAVSTTVAAGSTIRTLQLRAGGAKVAELLGGRRVRSDTTDEAERRLINVVEEMAIASGTPVPAIFVLDDESGINAFAAGYTLDDAAVAVTRGTLQQLTRDELQGVMAHEFSHILNGDMRLNIRLMGLLFGIMLLAIAGRMLLHTGGGRRSSRDSGGGQIAVIGIGLLVVGYIGVFFGRMIQAAVSRQREYLADAAAVQFTRNPEGLAGALKKIGGTHGSILRSPNAQEASHLFFASGMRRTKVSPLATHPPLADRIRRLDPSFDGDYPTVRLNYTAAELAAVGASSLTGASRRGPPIERSTLPAGEMLGGQLMASIGSPQPEHVAFAGELLRSLPPAVDSAIHSHSGAASLLLALMMHESDEGGGGGAEAVERQADAIIEYGGRKALDEVRSLAAEVRPLGAAARLPILDLLLPALRELSPDEAAKVHRTAQAMIRADSRTDVFELALLHVLGRQLAAGEPGHRGPRNPGEAVHSFNALREPIRMVVSAVSWSGAATSEGAATAFDAARSTLPRMLRDLTLIERSGVTIGDVDTALGKLRVASPPIRRLVLEAALNAVAVDGRVFVQEAELVRAVAEAVDCPMPPMIARAGMG